MFVIFMLWYTRPSVDYKKDTGEEQMDSVKGSDDSRRRFYDGLRSRLSSMGNLRQNNARTFLGTRVPELIR